MRSQKRGEAIYGINILGKMLVSIQTERLKGRGNTFLSVFHLVSFLILELLKKELRCLQSSSSHEKEEPRHMSTRLPATWNEKLLSPGM